MFFCLLHLVNFQRKIAFYLSFDVSSMCEFWNNCVNSVNYTDCYSLLFLKISKINPQILGSGDCHETFPLISKESKSSLLPNFQ